VFLIQTPTLLWGIIAVVSAVRIIHMGHRPHRAGSASWARILFILAFLTIPALSADISLELASPAVRRAPPGSVVTHVLVLRGSGEVTPTYASEHSWPILSPEKSIKLNPRSPTYLPVSVRIPPQANEGARDSLTIKAGSASLVVYTEASFRPGIEAAWPEKIAYQPPVAYLPLEVKNTGNGRDILLIKVWDNNEILIFNKQISLAAGQSIELQIPIFDYGSYKIKVASSRGRLSKEGVVAARPTSGLSNKNFSLIGNLRATYYYPDSLSASLGLSGPLSDYAYLNFGVGWALGALPAGSATISFDGGYFSVSYGPSYGLALGLDEGNLSTAISLLGPVPQGNFNLDFISGPVSSGVSANFNRYLSLNIYSEVALRERSNPVAPQLKSGSLRGEIAVITSEPRVIGNALYVFNYKSWPFRLAYKTDWSYQQPITNTFSLDANPHQADLGGYASWSATGLKDWGLSFASNNQRLGVKSILPFNFGASLGPDRFEAFAGTTIDLPEPWSDLKGRIETEYTKGFWSVKASGAGLKIAYGGLAVWNFGGTIGWPPEENLLSFGIRTNNSFLRSKAVATWSPWKPSLETSLTLEMPVSNSLLQANLGREWLTGQTSFSLQADLPLTFGVSPWLSRVFGGRRTGKLLGAVEVEGPPHFRKGIPVRIGDVETLTDDQGRFEVELPPGEYEVKIDESRLPATLVAISDGARVTVRPKDTVEVTLRVAVRAALEGRVFVKEKGIQPPFRFVIAITNANGKETAMYTDENGAFHVGGLPPGRYVVRLLTDFLPPDWKVLDGEKSVLLQPGQTGRVELAVRAPQKNVYHGGLQILEVKPEVATAPPGSAPVVTVKLSGAPKWVLVEGQGRVLGALFPTSEERVWQGRIKLPENYQGALAMQVIAHGNGGTEARYPFFISVNKSAPWGRIRAPLVAEPGQQIQVKAHWYASIEKCWAVVDGERADLAKKEADCSGSIRLPANATGPRIRLSVLAITNDGKQVSLSSWVQLKTIK